MTHRQKTIHKWFRSKGWTTKGTADNVGSVLTKEEFIRQPYYCPKDKEHYILNTSLDIIINPLEENFVTFSQSSWLTNEKTGEEVNMYEDIALRSMLDLSFNIYTSLTKDESLRLAELIEEIAKEAQKL